MTTSTSEDEAGGLGCCGSRSRLRAVAVVDATTTGQPAGEDRGCSRQAGRPMDESRTGVMIRQWVTNNRAAAVWEWGYWLSQRATPGFDGGGGGAGGEGGPWVGAGVVEKQAWMDGPMDGWMGQ